MIVPSLFVSIFAIAVEVVDNADDILSLVDPDIIVVVEAPNAAAAVVEEANTTVNDVIASAVDTSPSLLVSIE